MGCDGGTIPRRDELVRTKKKPEQKDKDSEREFRWLHCALTQDRLEEPIVMCGLGRLYSKQNVIEHLLEKDKIPKSAKHIKTMKDIKTLNVTPNPAYTEEDKCEGLLDTRHAPYICKLIGLEMSGKFRFIALWSCGCVMSERALKQIKKADINACPICQKEFAIDDVVVLNGGEEDQEMNQAKMEMRLEKRKLIKKDKKEKKIKSEIIPADVETVVDEDAKKNEIPSANVKEIGPSTSKSSLCHGVSLKGKIVANPKRLGGTEKCLEDPDIKRLKTEYSVAKDPKASDVYKSLFTSHHSEQQQNRAHWVTYNPFYN